MSVPEKVDRLVAIADNDRTPAPDEERRMHDDDYMDLALRAAEEAFARGDWPVGAVIVSGGQVIAAGQNQQVSTGDITIHAESDAIRRAIAEHGPARLANASLYCTMEPCPMCAWAIHLAGIGRLVLGLRHRTLERTDMGTYSIETFRHLTGVRYQLVTGVREAECLALRRRWGKDKTAS
jgi:tRNA(adenine34) deaminase